MKKFLIIAATLIVSVAAQAQQPVPVDPAVRVGKLDNGLTYYIRHHEEPAGQANFYIAQKVGSILEDEEQRGLAHFLEHMCFNGTEHFPGNGIIKYCESIGVEFGGDLNAYTSIDETVYNIDNVPVAKVPSAIDSCLWILHDWADGLLLKAEDIDSERGVIHEEWRTRRTYAIRLYEQILPAIYPGNRYGERLPIGLVEVIDNFPYQAIRDYYEKWYRPDQQGIIVVGDIDVDEIEAKIKDIFGTIATPVDPAERFYVQIEDNDEPIIKLAKDPENPYAQTYIFCKHDAYPVEMKSDISYLVYQYALNTIALMANERIEEMMQSANPPFIQAQIADDDFFIAKTKDAFTGVCVSSEAELTSAVTALYREMLRIKRFGFTASEYERAKAELISQVENMYNSRDKKKSYEFCQEYVQNFINGEPIPGIETEYALINQLAPAIGVEVINQVAASLIADNNLVIAAMLPDKEGVVYPSEEEFAASIAAVAAEDIEPYVEEVSDEPLISELPAPGKVVMTEDSIFGYKKYLLSNGATVYLKTTDFNADQILMRATSFGGSSLYPDSQARNLGVLSEVIALGGVGNFSRTALNKALAGKQVSVTPQISVYNEAVSGNSTPKDFETMLQLTYLNFTSLRSDEEAYASWKNRSYAALLNAESNPNTALQDSLMAAVYNGNKRVMQLKAAEIEGLDYNYIMNVARERFADASDFEFVFTGNIDEATALPLIEQYIGSLPSKNALSVKKLKKDLKKLSPKETYNSDAVTFAKGNVLCSFERQMEMPTATSVYFANGACTYDVKNSVSFELAMRALSVILLEEIREKEGGTYGINAAGVLSSVPRVEGYYQIAYQTNPDRVEYLNGRVEEILDAFAKDGCDEETLNKGKEYLVKNYQENLRENGFYSSAMIEYLQTGYDTITGYDEIVNSITVQDIVDSFNEVRNAGNLVKLVMVGTAE